VVLSKEEPMKRTSLLVFCMTLGAGALACSSGSDGGKSPKDPLDLVPASKAVSGWEVDVSRNKNGNEQPMTATDLKEVTGLIDGGAEAYFVESYAAKLFVWQLYTNDSLPAAPDGASIDLRVVEYPSADQAAGLYEAVVPLGDYARREWEPTSPAMGTASRIQDTGSQWWVNFYQGTFYVEVVLDPSTGPAPDYLPGDTDLKAEAIRFAQAVAGKM
jgi:hypothetical protein